ncbi:carbohydrate ABC transporter permease, partial [Paenibacillus sp. MCAF20]
MQMKAIGLSKHMLIILFGIAMLYPVLWLISSSFKPNDMIFTQTGLWPKEFTLDNYRNGWQGLQDVSF